MVYIFWRRVGLSQMCCTLCVDVITKVALMTVVRLAEGNADDAQTVKLFASMAMAKSPWIHAQRPYTATN